MNVKIDTHQAPFMSPDEDRYDSKSYESIHSNSERFYDTIH